MSVPSSEPRVSLTDALARIMSEVRYVEKKGKITSQGSGPSYKFARDVDVLDAVAPKLAEAGIVMVPEHTELLSISPNLRETQLIANIRTAWHVTDGHDSIRFETLGQGQDAGDKALPKAQSNARKYAFFMLFHIVTGDDPDQHASEQPEPGSRGQRGRVDAGQSRAGSTAPAPAPQRSPEEQQLLDRILATPGMGHARMSLMADAVGVPKGQHATADQLREMIARFIDQPAAPVTVGDEPEPAASPRGEAPAAPTLEDVLAVTGGELEPPKPGTDAYKALPTGTERAAARKYWDAQKAEPETLAEALGAPVGADR